MLSNLGILGEKNNDLGVLVEQTAICLNVGSGSRPTPRYAIKAITRCASFFSQGHKVNRVMPFRLHCDFRADFSLGSFDSWFGVVLPR